jgi:hypothetical protein
MAEVIGELNAESTYGEQQTRRLLAMNLPADYTVYVESPIRANREITYPDFVILASYGCIILEVKDWVTLSRVDPQTAVIRTRSGEERTEQNPVTKAREYGFALDSMIKTNWPDREESVKIPWSYAAVLFNQPPAIISQLRQAWGEDFVLGKAELENRDILLSHLRRTMPADRARPLTKTEREHVRAIINPIIYIEKPDQSPIVLDEPQERLITESVQPAAQVAPSPAGPSAAQASFIEPEIEETAPSDMPEAARKLLTSTGIRLVRGYSGSGKTLVMIQRAKYLASLYPDWKIGILTFNRLLKEELDSYFTGTQIEPRTFHGLCRSIVRFEDDQVESLDEWLKNQAMRNVIIHQLGRDNVEKEINWIRDVGLLSQADYLKAERHGIGRELPLSEDQKKRIFSLLSSYRSHLRQSHKWDWPELPYQALQKLDEGFLFTPFDALLIDEAQDWAPVWFQLVQRLISPASGLLFLADDPSQSIYRLFSWREKGIPVVGRTRWLRVPYRNTFEIYKAAYALIDGFPEIQKSLGDEGERVTPDLQQDVMRAGPRPILRHLPGISEEKDYIRNAVDMFLSQGYAPRQIAVLCKHKEDINNLTSRMQGTGVRLDTCYKFKGLEAEVVIIPFIHKTFLDPSQEAGERRLLYMAMSRARSQLLLTYSGRLPTLFQSLVQQELVDQIS